MKKISVLFLSLIILLSSAVSVFASDNICSYPTPTENAVLDYAVKLGANYQTAPTPPVVYNGFIYTVSADRLLKLDTKNGETKGSAALPGRNRYSVSSPIIAENTVFVQLDGGIVCALNADTLSLLWTYEDKLGGQALCPIVYDNGKIYTGFWNGETEKANFVCISTEDTDKNSSQENKNALWTYSSVGGFYRVGCAVTKNAVILGKDDGNNNSTSNSSIISLSNEDGRLLSELSVTGDIRCGVSYDDVNSCFFTASKSGYIYKFKANDNGTLHSLSSLKTVGEITSTPTAYNGRLYTLSSDNGKGRFYVLNADDLTEIYSASLVGYPQGEMLISNAYERSDGTVSVYFTVNSSSGELYLAKDSDGQLSADVTKLFIPENEYAEYCISPVTADENGTIYYKNDSGHIFALKEDLQFFEFQTIFSRLAEFLADIIRKFLELFISGDIL